jgi:hypothetical protein
MKKSTKITYWILTGIFAAFIIFSSIPDIMSTQDAVGLIKNQLGYPNYIIPFLGVAKLLGAIVLLIPVFPRLKEWAYAGITFDLVGAMYSSIAIGTPIQMSLFFLPMFAVLFASYFYWHKMQREKANAHGDMQIA